MRESSEIMVGIPLEKNIRFFIDGGGTVFQDSAQPSRFAPILIWCDQGMSIIIYWRDISILMVIPLQKVVQTPSIITGSTTFIAILTPFMNIPIVQ